jgi:hypothetical protein
MLLRVQIPELEIIELLPHTPFLTVEDRLMIID